MVLTLWVNPRHDGVTVSLYGIHTVCMTVDPTWRGVPRRWYTAEVGGISQHDHFAEVVHGRTSRRKDIGVQVQVMPYNYITLRCSQGGHSCTSLLPVVDFTNTHSGLINKCYHSATQIRPLSVVSFIHCIGYHGGNYGCNAGDVKFLITQCQHIHHQSTGWGPTSAPAQRSNVTMMNLCKTFSP